MSPPSAVDIATIASFRPLDLEEAARLAAGRSDLRVTSYRLDHLMATGGGAFDTTVIRVRLTCRDRDDAAISTSVILKVVAKSAGPRPAGALRSTDREQSAYRSPAFRQLLPPGLRMPECHQVIDRSDDVILVLEDAGPRTRDVDPSTYLEAARLLAHFNANGAAYDAAWLSHHALRDEVVDLVATPPDQVVKDHPLQARLYDDAMLDHLSAVHRATPRILRRIDALPTTVGHLDAFSRNMAVSDDEIVLFDWASTGRAPLGSDPAGLFWLTLGFLDVHVRLTRQFIEGVFESYLEGLDEAGILFDPAAVRFTYIATAALRHLAMMMSVYPFVAAEDPIIKAIVGHPVEHVIEVWAEAGAHMRDLTHEVLGAV